MKHIVSAGTLSLIIGLQASNIFLTKQQEQIRIEKIESGLLEKECDLFVASFLHSYKDISFVDLGLCDQEEQTRKCFLQRSFCNGARDLQKTDNKLYFFDAFLEQELVGLISFELINETTVYVHQLAVAPQYKHKGIGRALIAYCLESFPERTVALVVRKLNEEAKAFVKKLGFSETSNLFAHDCQHFIGFVLPARVRNSVLVDL